jgi:hypothetical protein
VDTTVLVSPSVNLDFNDHGRLVGVEIPGAGSPRRAAADMHWQVALLLAVHLEGHEPLRVDRPTVRS